MADPFPGHEPPPGHAWGNADMGYYGKDLERNSQWIKEDHGSGAWNLALEEIPLPAWVINTAAVVSSAQRTRKVPKSTEGSNVSILSLGFNRLFF